jgi:hypothetical protein
VSAKDLELKPIPAKRANDLVRQLHYSGKVTQNSQLHIGVFYRGSLEGALQFGPGVAKRNTQKLVRGTPWNGFTELNRMALSDRLPRNSESRTLAVAMRIMRRHAPQLRWVLTFADGSQCGDGTIYRAAGFLLTGIKTTKSLARLPDGSVVHEMSVKTSPNKPREELGGRTFMQVARGSASWGAYLKAARAEVIPGFQLRYVKFLDPAWASRLTVPVLPYSAIDEAGARMYRGEKPGP